MTIALIRNEYREGLLREMGVKHFVNPDDPDWLEQVRALTTRLTGQVSPHGIFLPEPPAAISLTAFS